MWSVRFCFFVFNATATTEIYTYGHTLSRHDALPISLAGCGRSISRHRREKIQLAKKRDAVLNRAPSSTFFWEAQPLQGPTLVLVTCICISMSPPPIGDLPFEVTRTSLFLVSRVPARASSTFCAPCVQVPATSILPLPISFLLQVQASP